MSSPHNMCQLIFINAKIDGEEKSPIVPQAMGAPREDQFMGTYLEKLCEIAGRVCYDSFGKGRSSKEYHEHILEVMHTSVYEHGVFTTEVQLNSLQDLRWYFNRPGILLQWPDEEDLCRIQVTMNLRSVLDWNFWSVLNCAHMCVKQEKSSILEGDTFRHHAYQLAPNVIPHMPAYSTGFVIDDASKLNERQIFLTFWINTGRDVSHELIRHRTLSPSQRSTRYVDESESCVVSHPILREHVIKHADKETMAIVNRLIEASHAVYSTVFGRLSASYTNKQARGAARQWLPTATATQLILTGSIFSWKQMLSQRLHEGADGSMRELALLIKEKVDEVSKVLS